jgi:xanthine dehydrogenase accessory factor
LSQWVQALHRIGAEGREAVVVTMASGKGSTPREAGAKMVVTPDAIQGTIGGGDVEFQAIDIARDMLRETDARRSRRFPLGASFGQYCGGAANLVFELVPPGADWVGVLAAWLEAGEGCVMVTPAQEAGSGGKLLVGGGNSYGSLGNPESDAAAMEAGRRLLGAAGPAATLAAIAQGKEALFERVEPVRFNVVLFGAGHVGRALVRVLGTLAVRITWVDSRANEFPREVPDNVRVALTDTPLAEVSGARPGSCFLVMTHSHALDLDLVEAILRRDDIAFCGMIGSDTKRRTFENGLAKRGLDASALARFTCPIGIASLTGKDPGTIAVAVAAQLLERWERAAA